MAELPAITPVASARVRRRASKRFSFERKQITAIDVDGQVLRVVQTLHRGGTTKVTRFAAAPLDLADTADLDDPIVVGTAIAKALRNLGLKPGKVVMGVPRAKVVLRTLSLPPADSRGELAAMVHFQVAKDLPFRLDEAVVDFKVHGPVSAIQIDAKGDKPSPIDRKPDTVPGDTKLAVLVAAAKHEVVEFYQKMAQAAGVKLTALGLRSYANARCVEACEVTERDENVALISLRPDEVIIDVMVDQSLVFSRVASVKHPTNAPENETGTPPDAISPAEALEEAGAEADFAQAVTIEVVRSLHSYEGIVQAGRIHRVVVAGGTGQELAVVAALEKRLNRPCIVLDPAAALSLPESKRAHATGALVAFGLGLGVNDPEGLPFDFLNPKRPAPPRNWRRIKMVAATALTALVLVSALGIRSYLIRERTARKTTLAALVVAEEKNRPLYRKLRMQSRIVDEWLKEDHRWLDHYAYLSTVLPPTEEIYATSLSTGSRDNLRLTVQAKSGDTIAKLDRLLRVAGYDVKPLAITPSADKYGYPFKSTVELVVPDKMQAQLAKRLSSSTPPASDKPPTPPAKPPAKGGG